MKLDGNELISRATASSSRNLAIASSGIVYISWFNLNPAEWGLLNDQVGAEAFRGGAVAIVLYLTFSLLMNWIGDFISYRRWFKSNEFALRELPDSSSPKAGEPPLSGLIRRLSVLSDQLERLPELEPRIDRAFEELPAQYDVKYLRNKYEHLYDDFSDLNKKIVELSSILHSTHQIVDELDVRFRKTDVAARFQVYLWHFGLPIALSIWSLYIFYSSAA